MKNTIKISAVGDIMLGEMPGMNGIGVLSCQQKNGFDKVFDNVLDCFSKSDLIVGNLETVLSDIPKSKQINDISLIADKRSLDSLKKVGFNVLNVANNHNLDHGIEKFCVSVDLLLENQIHVIGSSYNNCIYQILNVNGIKILIIGFSLAKDNNHKKGYYYKPDNIIEIIQLIEETKNTGIDHIIVSVHWGNEHILLPSPEQIELAHKMIDAGATLILGHHPHCYQGIEKYKQGMIVYSLGNFVFDLSYPMSRESIIFECNMNKDSIINYNIIPVCISKNGIPNKVNYHMNKYLLDRFNNIDEEINNIKNSYDYSTEYKSNYQISFKRFKRYVRINFIKKMFKLNPIYTVQLLIKYLYKSR